MVELSTPEGYNSRLLTGLGQLLDAEDLGVFATSGTYPEEGWAVFIGLTPDKPDRAITLMSYPVEDTDLTSVITGVQFRFRGGRDPREIENQSDAVYNLLHNKEHYALNGVSVNLSWRQSGAWMGQDTNQRIERVENFYLRTEREAPFLRA
ncbi:tail terminator [Streptomyces phage Keanu]|nr:tail terminator [Streptomyces phage Keanu]